MNRRALQRRPRRLRRWFVAAILLLTGAAAAWRFVAQSLSVNSLVPFVERTLERAAPGVDLEIASISLRWGGFRRGVDLALEGIAVHTGGARLDVAEVLLKLSLRALLHGHLAPAQIEVIHPTGKLVRDADGKIRLVAFGAGTERPVRGRVFEDLLRDLASEGDPARPLTFLRSIRLSGAEVELTDLVYGVTWSATGIELDLYPAGTDIAGELRADVHIEEHTSHLEGRLTYDGPTRTFDGALALTTIPVEALLARVPWLHQRLRLRSEAEADVGLAIDLDGTLHHFDAHLSLSGGELQVPGWLDDPEPLRPSSFAAGFVGAGGWRVGPMALELGPPDTAKLRIDLDGNVANPDKEGGRVAQLRLRLPRLAVEDLVRYWPTGAIDGTRKWIDQHITAGRIEALEARAVLRQRPSEPIRVERIAGEFDLRDLDVPWHDRAPAVTDLSGHARFDRTDLRIGVDTARVKGLEIAASSVDLLHLDRKNGDLQIHLEGRGPASTAMEAIDLHLPSFLGTADSRGESENSNISFKADIGFTMKKRVRLRDLTLDVDAQVDAVRLDSDLGEGLFSGRLRFVSPGSPQRLLGDVDLGRVASGLAVLGWNKPVGKPARAQFELLLDDGKVRTIESFDLQADGLSTRGSARFHQDGRGLQTLDLRSLRSGRTNVDQARVTWTDNGLQVHLEGGDVDLVPLRQRPTSLATHRDRPRLDVEAKKIDRLFLNETGWLADVSGSLQREGKDWQRLQITAAIPDAFVSARAARQPALRLSLSPSKYAGLLDLRLTSEDFGGLLRALHWSDDVDGGSLIVQGADVGRQFQRGRLSVRASDFHVGDAPWAVRLLTLASLETIVNLMQTSALHFEELEGDLELRDDLLLVHDVLGHGSSLGWRAHGSVNLAASTLDLGGTLIPAYTANRLLNAVPVLREVLVGEGILSVDYRINGTLAAPVIDTNPMSAITPEALRDIFDPGRRRR